MPPPPNTTTTTTTASSSTPTSPASSASTTPSLDSEELLFPTTTPNRRPATELSPPASQGRTDPLASPTAAPDAKTRPSADADDERRGPGWAWLNARAVEERLRAEELLLDREWVEGGGAWGDVLDEAAVRGGGGR